jgi:rhamnose transport system permease protein
VAAVPRRIVTTRGAGLVVLLALLVVAFAVQSPNFLTASNFFTIARLDAEIGLLALGMAVVIASGGIDLSVGAILALSSVTLGQLYAGGTPLPAAIALALGVAVVCGLVNGALVVLLDLHPLLVTLGTLALYRGLALGVSNASGYSTFPTWFEYFGQAYLGPLPAQLVVWAVVGVVVYVVTRHTAAGRQLLSVGVNELAARYAAVRLGLVRMAVYGTSGLLAGIASLIYTSRVFSARGDSGGGLELLAIAAVVLGGASIRGGEISVPRTTLAVFVIGVIPNGFVLAGIDTSWQYVAIGVVMVVAIALNERLNRDNPGKDVP